MGDNTPKPLGDVLSAAAARLRSEAGAEPTVEQLVRLLTSYEVEVRRARRALELRNVADLDVFDADELATDEEETTSGLSRRLVEYRGRRDGALHVLALVAGHDIAVRVDALARERADALLATP